MQNSISEEQSAPLNETLWQDEGTNRLPVVKKWCPTCEKRKKLDEFYMLKNGKPACYCILCSRKRNKKNYKEHGKSEEKRIQEQELFWFRKFGITSQQYDAMFEAQEGLCAACGCPETIIDGRSKRVRILSIDHCHKTGKVRALLCGACNTSLGFFNEDPKRIEGLLRYAEKIQS
jgi:hypothetical protein